MKTITDIFDSAFRRLENEGYSKLYLAIDMHGTVLAKTKRKIHASGGSSEMVLPPAGSNGFMNDAARSALQKLSHSPKVRLTMFTSSPPNEIEKMVFFLKENEINVDFINENPEVDEDVSYVDFSRKFFFDILLDDKAGFDPDTDWNELDLWLDSHKDVL